MRAVLAAEIYCAVSQNFVVAPLPGEEICRKTKKIHSEAALPQPQAESSVNEEGDCALQMQYGLSIYGLKDVSSSAVFRASIFGQIG